MLFCIFHLFLYKYNGLGSLLQARLAKNGFFLASICHAITDPPVTKIRDRGVSNRVYVLYYLCVLCTIYYVATYYSTRYVYILYTD